MSTVSAIGQFKIEAYNTANSPISANEIFTVKFIDNAMWIGTWNKGLCRVKNDIWTNLTSDSLQTTSNNITDIYQDKKGNIWVVDYGYNSGSSVVRYDGHSWQLVSPTNDPFTHVSGISEDKNGNLWFKTYGSGIYYYDLDQESWTHITPLNSGLSDLSIRCIIIDESNRKWIGHYNAGYDVLDDSTWTNHFGVAKLNVETIEFGLSDEIWIGTWGYGILIDNYLNILDTTNSILPSNNISVIKKDDFNRFWIGTENGLVIKDGEEWITFQNTILKNTEIRDITFENDSSIWISTWGEGLIHLTPEKTSSLYLVNDNPISLYPNPFGTGINLSIPRSLAIERIEIFSLAGQLMKRQNLTETGYIDLEDFPSGQYLLRLFSKTKVYTDQIQKTSGL